MVRFGAPKRNVNSHHLDERLADVLVLGAQRLLDPVPSGLLVAVGPEREAHREIHEAAAQVGNVADVSPGRLLEGLAGVVLDAARDQVEERQDVTLVGRVLDHRRVPARPAGACLGPGLRPRADRDGVHLRPPFRRALRDRMPPAPLAPQFLDRVPVGPFSSFKSPNYFRPLKEAPFDRGTVLELVPGS